MWFIQQNYIGLSLCNTPFISKVSEFMLEVCPLCADTSAKTTMPPADSGINDRLVKLRPLIDVFLFISVSYSGAIDSFPRNTPDAVIDRVQVWRIRRPQRRGYEVGRFLLQGTDSVACPMGWRPSC